MHIGGLLHHRFSKAITSCLSNIAHSTSAMSTFVGTNQIVQLQVTS